MPRAPRGVGFVAQYVCDCGAELATDAEAAVAQHERSAKHQRWAAQLIDSGGTPSRDQQPYDPDDPDDHTPPHVNALDKKAQEQLDEAGVIIDGWQGDLADALSAAAPVPATYVQLERDANTRAALLIARNHPRVLELILKSASYQGYAQLGKFSAGLIVSGGVEMGWLNADGGPARMTGVMRAWELVQAERAEIEEEVGDHYRTVLDGYATQRPPGLFGELATGS